MLPRSPNADEEEDPGEEVDHALVREIREHEVDLALLQESGEPGEGRVHKAATPAQKLDMGCPELGPPKVTFECPNCGREGSGEWMVNRMRQPRLQRWEWQCWCGMCLDYGKTSRVLTYSEDMLTQRFQHVKGGYIQYQRHTGTVVVTPPGLN